MMKKSVHIVATEKQFCSFGNDSARNVIIFEFGNSSSSHTDNLKNEILILGSGQAFGINGSFGASEKKN